jgi:hypothetical protein
VGDRANIICHQYPETPAVWIYTHWHGSELPSLLANALDTPQAKARIGDPSYLTRIVFCQIIKQVDDLDGETGWGIGTTECDNGHRYLHLDTVQGRVGFGDTPMTADEWLTIDEFVAKHR